MYEGIQYRPRRIALMAFFGLAAIATGILMAIAQHSAARMTPAQIQASIDADPIMRNVQCYEVLPLLEREVYDKLSSDSQARLDLLDCRHKAVVLNGLANFRPDMRDEVLARAIDQAAARRHARR